ncbi:GntR family transcriptional regulator [Micrococcoides hystricis]|uniref:GntR family transcriptional regulator n=1 Tax=Micrococcoides hystricis TaxID=1572761 RepID=A0ABV6PBZ4_9MICC
MSSKSDRAYDAILERISSGDYGPGYRLVLSSIAAELDMSVVPVREAIRRLQSEELVAYERNVGATVVGIDPTVYQYTMETLALVEGYATALCAPLVPAEDIAKARAINEQMRECLTHFDPVQFTQLNRDFHSVLFTYCPNPHILDLVQRGWARLGALRSSTFAYVPGRAAESVDEHEAILALIESGADFATVEEAARAHRYRTLEAYLAHRSGHK